MDFLSEREDLSPKITSAWEEGYDDEAILGYLSQKPQKEPRKGITGAIQKGGRLASQFLIGRAEQATLPYNILAQGAGMAARNPPLEVAKAYEEKNPALAKEVQAQQSPAMQGLEKQLRGALEDQAAYEKEHKLFPEWVKEQNWDVGSLLEKGFEMAGIDMHPEDLSEHALRFAGFVSDPQRLMNLTKEGIDLANKPEAFRSILKSIIPTGKELSRGVGAATALQVAADNNLGPMGQLAAIVIGDMVSGGAPIVGKSAAKFAKAPIKTTKELAAKATVKLARLSGKEQSQLQADLINSFRDAGIQADLGSITGSNLVKYIQARLAQSSLFGGDLEKFKHSLTQQIVSEYKGLADSLGESRFQSLHEAGTALKEGVIAARDADLKATRELYTNATETARNNNATIYPGELIKAVNGLEAKLEPGSIKGGQQKAVLKVLDDLKKDIMTPEGDAIGAKVVDLINNKLALNDIIDYEALGGAKKLLKGLVRDLDKAIMSYGKENPEFARNWAEANSRFAKHAKTFRNKNIAAIFKDQDPATLLGKMNSIESIKRVQRALSGTPQGERLFNDLKRMRFEELVMKNMIDGATDQLKFGKFANILEKGKNREIARALLGEESFHRLERLQKATGKLGESAQKFFNASKSGTTAIDAGIVTKALFDLGSLLGGNPWPFMKTAGGYIGMRGLAKLITDPVFLKTVEDGMLAAAKNDGKGIQRYFGYLTAPIRSAFDYQGSPYSAEALEHGSMLQRQAAKVSEAAEGIPTAKEGFKPIAPTRVTGVNEVLQKKYDPEIQRYIENEPRYWMTKDDKELRNLQPISPQQEVVRRNQWNKFFNPDKYDDFYPNFNAKTPKTPKQLGTLGDWIIGKKLRHILRDVLDTPITTIEGWDALSGAWGSYNPITRTISLNRGLSPAGLLNTLAHESWHALQDLKGKLDLNKYIPSSSSFEAYIKQPIERNARLFERWATKDIQKTRQAQAKTQTLGSSRIAKNLSVRRKQLMEEGIPFDVIEEILKKEGFYPS